MEHEGGHIDEAHLARKAREVVERLFHRIAHEDERVDPARFRFVDGVLEDARDLCFATDAAHLAHRRVQIRRAREPAARLALAEAAIEHELDVEPAEACRRLEHLALQPARVIPGGFAARGRVEGKDQPSPARGRLNRRHRRDLPQESLNLRLLGLGGKPALGASLLVRHPINMGSAGWTWLAVRRHPL